MVNKGKMFQNAHYQNPLENHFVSGYGGSCLACHKLDPEKGTVSIKSGPNNW